MTQVQTKRTTSLRSVNRMEEPLIDTTAVGERGVKPHATDDTTLDAFVFEEVGAMAAASPKKQPAPQAGRSDVSATVERDTSPGGTQKLGALPAPPLLPNFGTRPAEVPASAAGPDDATAKSSDAREEMVSNQPLTPSRLLLGRNDLELRGKLNQKESELLAVRDELSLRERSLLELNDKLLEVERSRLALGEKLEESAHRLEAANDNIRAQQADKEATEKHIAELKVSFRRHEELAKRKGQQELDKVRAELTAELAKQATLHESKVEQLTRNHAAEAERLQLERALAEEQTAEQHSEALKKVEATGNQAISRATAAYAAKVRSLEDIHARGLEKAAAYHSATLDAALSTAASEKAQLLAEAESTLRSTQGDLASAVANTQFLERMQTNQATRIARQEARVASLEEALANTTAKADTAAETLASLRTTLSAGLSLLNRSSAASDGQ